MSMDFKDGDRVRIYYKVDGEFGLGTVEPYKEGLCVRPDQFPEQYWRVGAHKLEISLDDPEPTLEERIKEQWPDKEVVILEWHNSFLLFDGHLHIKAPSMKGFWGYIYERYDSNNFVATKLSTRNNENADTVHPIAVIFST